MKRYKLIPIVFVLALFPLAGLAQSGKIEGVITDAENGEPLIGATVGIQGTTTGAVTNIDGEYLMLNVAPGTYILEARYIGYATVVVQEVVVRTDLTTEQNFELSPESFAGEEVVVVAERRTVIKDITSSEARVSSEEIAKLPVQEVGDVVQLQAGVNVDNDGGIHIRGGRTTEVSYVVDGIRVTDDYDGSSGIRLENESIQELQVISGSFNAEHGQALSGIVNVVTKSGGNQYDASVRAWTGGYYAANKSYLYDGIGTEIDNLNPFRMYNFTGSVSGPIIKEKLTFFATARKFENEGWLTGRNYYSPHGRYVARVPLGTDMNTFRTLYNERVDTSLSWYSMEQVVLEGDTLLEIRDNGLRDSSLVNMNRFEALSFQGNLEFRMSNMLKFNLIGSFAQEEGRDYNGYTNRLVALGQKRNFRDNYTLNFKTTITPSHTTFITVNVANRYNSYESYVYDDPWDPRYFNYANLSDAVFGNANALYGITPNQDGQFAAYGTDNNRFFRSTNTYIGKIEVSSQVHDNHFIKAGVNVQVDELKYENVDLAPLDEDGVLFPPGTPQELRNVCSPTNERYPCLELGFPELNSPGYQKYNKNPITFSGYIQDKIEFESLIINVGLRFDYFNPNSRIPADPEDPDINVPTKPENIYIDLNGNGDQDPNEDSLTVADREAYWWKDASVKYQVSPRIGVAYPINENGVIYFSYGYFFQMPSYERLYNNSLILLSRSGADQGLFGNPDLKPEKSVQYELGLKQEIFDGTAIELTGFYKDTRDYVSSRPQVTGGQQTYGIYFNRDYSKSYGFTFAFNQYVSRQFNFGLDYTFGAVEGTNSDPGSEYFLIRDSGITVDSTNQKNSIIKILQPLDWDRTHIINGSMFYTGKNWAANLLARFSSGTPYTPNNNVDGVLVGEVASTRDLRNTARLPARFTIDLNLNKTFDIPGPSDIEVFLNIYNLFDTKIINRVYTDSGEPTRPLPVAINANAAPGFYDNPTFYGEPRRIQFGVQLSF